MSSGNRLLELINELEVLHEKKVATLRKLHRAVIAKDWMPDFFDHGVVSTRAVPKVSQPKSILFTVSFSRKDEPNREFDLIDVPVELWPWDMRTELRMDRRWFRSKYYNKLKEFDNAK